MSAHYSPSAHFVASTKFHSAIILDTFIGNYWTIVIFLIFIYLPGLLLIALVAKPYLLGDTFPTKALYAAYFFFFPGGAGAIKACVSMINTITVMIDPLCE